MPKKPLLIFSYDFPPGDGGIARLTAKIAEEMLRHYDAVEVLTRKNEGPARALQHPAIKIHKLAGTRLAAEWKALRFLRAISDKKEVTVLCGLWHPEATLALIAGFKKVHCLAHGAELLPGGSTFRKRIWLGKYARSVFGRTTVIANSRFTASLCQKISKNASVHTLPLAVDTNRFRPAQRPPAAEKLVIGTVSRLLKFKGHDLILRAISALPESYKGRIEWRIAGTGPYLEPLKQRVKESGLDKMVEFRGYVPEDDLPKFYRDLDLFVLLTQQTEISNQVEGFGLVFLEAQSSGVPVIGSDTGGIPSAIEKGNGGWLIPQQDHKGLGELLIEFVDNPKLLQEAGKLARKRVEEECNWPYYCDRLYKILQSP